MNDSDDLFMEVSEATGRKWGMTASELLQHIVIGDIPHPDAPSEECGMTDPRDGSKWCRRLLDHDGDHNRYLIGE